MVVIVARVCILGVAVILVLTAESRADGDAPPQPDRPVVDPTPPPHPPIVDPTPPVKPIPPVKPTPIVPRSEPKLVVVSPAKPATRSAWREHLTPANLTVTAGTLFPFFLIYESPGPWRASRWDGGRTLTRT